MERFKLVGEKIVAFINDPYQKVERMVVPWRGTRFVVCGTSGSGKSRALHWANQMLPASEQIAESREIAKDASLAIKIIQDGDLMYERSLHIAFAVYHERLGKDLERNGVKVFWLDCGISK